MGYLGVMSVMRHAGKIDRGMGRRRAEKYKRVIPRAHVAQSIQGEMRDEINVRVYTCAYIYRLETNLVCQLYTLSHPDNDRDVTERFQEYTLQDASFMLQSTGSFLMST